MSQTRRLAAILATDVAGYSRLMGADEEGTHERLKAHLRELVDPKIAEYRGRIVKNTGDGMLVEFSSVVDAVRCAVEVQRAMADREPEVPDEQRIRFRPSAEVPDALLTALPEVTSVTRRGGQVLVTGTGDVLSAEIQTFLEQTGVPGLSKPFDRGEVRRVIQIASA